MLLASTFPGKVYRPTADAPVGVHGVFLLGRCGTLDRVRTLVHESRSALYLAGEAGNLLRGLHLLRQRPCALVVLELPWHGNTCLRLLRACTDARVLAVAPSGQPAAIEEAMRMGMDGVLCSGEDPAAWLRTLHLVLDGHIGLDAPAVGSLFLRAARRAAAESGPPRARLCTGP